MPVEIIKVANNCITELRRGNLALPKQSKLYLALGSVKSESHCRSFQLTVYPAYLIRLQMGFVAPSLGRREAAGLSSSSQLLLLPVEEVSTSGRGEFFTSTFRSSLRPG